MTNYLEQILSYFRNIVLNKAGAERDLYQLIEDGDIPTAIEMMQNRDEDVEEALKEYNPKTHEVMNRPNKQRKSADAYKTEKLPRARQRYINEVELFFLLGNNVVWSKKDGDDEAYELFNQFLEEHRWFSKMRTAKRLAGAETESAKLYHIYKDDESNDRKVVSLILSRSKGYQLRPFFDQYNNLLAFAYGYKLKENGKNVQHWDIQTPELLFYCKKGAIGWEVDTFKNPTGKINAIYYRQNKAWEGVEARLEREEMLDSKVADTNNYFADPIASATADVVEFLSDRESTPAKLIQLAGGGSKFEYINPPQNSETRESEKSELKDSILFDTFTPDFSFNNLKGLGTLSGTAIKNAMILGYIKRDNLREIYDELIDREKNVIIGILKYLYPNMASKLDSLVIEHELSEPFAIDNQAERQSITNLYSSGVLSLEKAVEMLSLTDAPEEEIQRIKEEKTEKPEPVIGFKSEE